MDFFLPAYFSERMVTKTDQLRMFFLKFTYKVETGVTGRMTVIITLSSGPSTKMFRIFFLNVSFLSFSSWESEASTPPQCNVFPTKKGTMMGWLVIP